MTTTLTLITDAMAKARVYSPGESLPSHMSASALRELNRMLETWANSSLLIPHQTEETLTLTANKANYTIGSSASYDFNTVRPMEILEGSFLRDTGGTTDYPLAVKALKEYRDITNKSASSIPWSVSYSPTYPYGTIYFWWTPGATYGFHLLSLKPLTALTLAATVSLQPGYEDAIVYNLALRIGPDYGKTIRPDVAEFARDALASIRRQNAKRLPPTRLEVGGFVNNRGTHGDIVTGPYV